jgi:hypothetical protein
MASIRFDRIHLQSSCDCVMPLLGTLVTQENRSKDAADSNTGEEPTTDPWDACGGRFVVPPSNETNCFLRIVFAGACRVLLKQLFAHSLEEMKVQYIWSVRWYGLIERVQLPKPTRPSLSHFHYTLRSPETTRVSARTC